MPARSLPRRRCLHCCQCSFPPFRPSQLSPPTHTASHQAQLRCSLTYSLLVSGHGHNSWTQHSRCGTIFRAQVQQQNPGADLKSLDAAQSLITNSLRNSPLTAVQGADKSYRRSDLLLYVILTPPLFPPTTSFTPHIGTDTTARYLKAAAPPLMERGNGSNAGRVRVIKTQRSLPQVI